MYQNTDVKKFTYDFIDFLKVGRLSILRSFSNKKVLSHNEILKNKANRKINNAFPLTKNWLTESVWNCVINNFFEKNDMLKCQSSDLILSFKNFVLNNQIGCVAEKPIFNDLLYYEWVILKCGLSQTNNVEEFNKDGDAIYNHLALNPVFKLFLLSYPVHIQKPEDANMNKGEWFLLAYMNQKYNKVEILNISALHYFVLKKIKEKPRPVYLLLPMVAKEFGLSNTQHVREHLRLFLMQLIAKGAILGYVVRD